MGTREETRRTHSFPVSLSDFLLKSLPVIDQSKVKRQYRLPNPKLLYSPAVHQKGLYK